MKTLKLHFRIENGHLIKKANIHRIRAVSSRLCTGVSHSRIDPKTYKETWIIVKGPHGYEFREITHGAGLCGMEKTLRGLILRSFFGLFGMKEHVQIVLAEEELKPSEKLVQDVINSQNILHAADQKRRAA